MRAGRGEVVDILRAWRDGNCEIRVQGSFALFAFASVGRIRLLDDLELRIISDDTPFRISS
jgi:hypothetical protein